MFEVEDYNVGEEIEESHYEFESTLEQKIDNIIKEL